MAGMDIRPIDLILLISVSVFLVVQALSWGANVAEAVLDAVIGFLAGLGTMLLLRKLRKIVRKKQ